MSKIQYGVCNNCHRSDYHSLINGKWVCPHCGYAAQAIATSPAVCVACTEAVPEVVEMPSDPRLDVVTEEDELITRAREMLGAMVIKHPRHKRVPLSPAPRYDKVFAEGIAVLDAEDDPGADLSAYINEDSN